MAKLECLRSLMLMIVQDGRRGVPGWLGQKIVGGSNYSPRIVGVVQFALRIFASTFALFAVPLFVLTAKEFRAGLIQTV